MPSNFSNLFRYARAEKMDAKENFTTEALAASIRYDPAPFVAVMRARGWLPSAATLEIVPHTQVHVPGVGFIDLVVEARDETRVWTLWVEVKVDAGEHGAQLTHYRTFVEAHPGMVLFTLGREALRDDIEHVMWRDMRRAALAVESPHWRDFAAFLEEIGMADDYEEPLADSELDSLGNAYDLLRKAAHVLAPVGAHANKAWPGSGWPTGIEEVRRGLGAQLARHRRLTIQNGAAGVPLWLIVGVELEASGRSRAGLKVSVQARPKDLSTRSALENALRTRLGDGWTWERQGWSVVTAQAPAPTDRDLAGVSHWFTERLDELARAGLFALAKELGATDSTGFPDDGDGAPA